MDYPKDRKTAKAQGAAHYFTGEPCKRGHIAARETKGNCTACRKEDDARVRDARAAYFEQYNKSAAGVKAKQDYYERNKESVIARALARPTAEKQAYRKAWKLDNPLQVAADRKSRRSKHRAATPCWLTAQQRTDMRRIYETAITLSKTTGTPYVVDHIVPLRHPLVCGLHVPWNLQVMTREDNLKKSNKVDGL